MNKQSFSSNKLFNSCRRCLNPWIVGIILVLVVGLIIFTPIIGVATLLVALPLAGCTVMCGAMGYMMVKRPKKK